LFWRFFLEAEEALWDGKASQEQVDRDCDEEECSEEDCQKYEENGHVVVPLFLPLERYNG